MSENTGGANKVRQFGHVVQMKDIEKTKIEQRQLSEARNEIKDSIVQKYMALSLDCVEEQYDMYDEEASTLIQSIKSWSQDNLDRLMDEDDSDGEINDQIFARRQPIPTNRRILSDFIENVDKLWNSNASNSAEDEDDSDIFGFTNFEDYLVETYNPLHGKGILFRMSLRTEMIDISDIDRDNVPFTLRRQPDKLGDINELRHSGIDENFHEYLDNDLAKDATNEMEHHIYNNDFCGANLDGNPNSDTKLSFTPIPINTHSDYDENIYDSVENEYVQYENAVGGAYLDENQNDRIGILCDSKPELPPRSKTHLSTPKLQLVIQELIDTEKTYLESMEFVIQQYLKYFLNHPEKSVELPGIPAIFGNIEYLYESSKKILEDLLNCNSSVDCIANIFLQSKQLFQLYAEYLRNKARTRPVVEKLFKKHLTQRQVELKDKKTCDSYLLTPLQRPLRYKLLLERLQSELKKLGRENKNLEAAITFVALNNQQINTLLAFDSINDCPIDLIKFGGMQLLKDKFNIKRKYKSVVFLFEETIVFTTKNKLQKETYDYKDSINVNVLAFKRRSKSSFIVSNHSECKYPDGDGLFSFELENSSEAVCETWVKEIGNILKNQFYQFKHVLKKK